MQDAIDITASKAKGKEVLNSAAQKIYSLGLGYSTPTMYVYVNYKIVYYTHTPLSVISGCFEKHCISIGQTRNSMCKY